VLVNAGLVQDAFVVPSPNRAFWSIAIEAQLYLVFPLLILLARRLSPAVMVALVGIPVAYLGVLAARGEPVASHLVNQYTPDLGVLFAIGVAAAGALTHAASRTRPWVAYAVALAVPPVVLITATGSAWTINHLFWVDLAIGPAIACLLLAAATGQGPRLQRALDSGPVRRLGAISYSLYLTHAPIVIALYYGWLRGRVEEGVPMFLLLTVVTIPITVAFARLFAAVFELPFQRHRGWTALRDSLRLRTVAHGDDAAERAQIRAAVRPERQPRIVVVEAESGAG
jgi:peptidoglycan/LPS O-acetylase OafA/YrhL